MALNQTLKGLFDGRLLLLVGGKGGGGLHLGEGGGERGSYVVLGY